jgi:L-ascorbate metabolism protein UlaG (beta-lactamase superfamily)
MADNGTLTWLGHGSFRLDSPGGKRVYLDPWLENPTCPDSERSPERVDVIAISHGHSDHIGSVVDLAGKHSPAIVAIFDLVTWLESKGVEGGSGMNKGGTQEVEGIKFTMTHALHSGGFMDEGRMTYLGDAAGYVITLENGFRLYFAGDTAVFSDMQLIGRIYQPDVAVLPIGDHFTMGPAEAAVALELLGVKRCVPSHYGTFPLLTGTPETLRELAPGVQIDAVEPGGTVQL